MRRGIKTTEFWLTLLLNIGAVTASLSGNLTPKYAAYAGAISISSYAIARALTKLGDPSLNGSPEVHLVHEGIIPPTSSPPDN